jgi:hypothetical protein
MSEMPLTSALHLIMHVIGISVAPRMLFAISIAITFIIFQIPVYDYYYYFYYYHYHHNHF